LNSGARGQEFKVGKAPRAGENAKPQEKERGRSESVSRLWPEVREAFKEKPRLG